MKNYRLSSFTCGLVSAVCVLSLFQDYCGVERYLDMARRAWVPAIISVPVALVFLAVAIVCDYQNDQELRG